MVIFLCLFECYICLCCCLASTNPKQEILKFDGPEPKITKVRKCSKEYVRLWFNQNPNNYPSSEVNVIICQQSKATTELKSTFGLTEFSSSSSTIDLQVL